MFFAHYLESHGVYSRVVTIRGGHLMKEMQYHSLPYAFEYTQQGRYIHAS